MLTERQAQAIHEAGHAIVAHFMGFRILEVQWAATGARILFDETFTQPKSEQEAVNALIVQVAGYAAMRKAGVSGRLLVSEYLRHHAGNLAICSDPMVASVLIDRVLAWRGEPSPAPLARTIDCVENAEKHAFALLNQHWAAVEAVARVLHKSHSITGEEVHRIIDQANPSSSSTAPT